MRLWALPKDGYGPRRELRIEELWPHKGHLVLKFEGVDSISDAETLIGCELQVPASERSKLGPGWVYVSDLVGCDVFDGDREIGRVQDVQFGAGEAPLLVVKAGTSEYEIPYAEAYLKGADLEQKKICMILPEGMLELNAPMTAEEKEQQTISNKKPSS
jgi:16S rRNA processing protein RimM